MRTSHLVLASTILLALAAATLPAAEPGNACGPAAFDTAADSTAGGGPEASLHRRLVELDRELRRSLVGVARNAGRLDPAVLEDDVASYRDALRDLERRAHGLEATAAPRWLQKVRRLYGLLANLERAAAGADPAGALPRGGARSAPALRVPSPPNLAPANDDCADAFDLVPGQTVTGDTSEATQDGQASCGSSLFSSDVWFKVTAPQTTMLAADTFGSGYDTVLSVHSGCPGTLDNEIRCNDDAFGLDSAVSFDAVAGEDYWIRLSGFDQAAGPYELHLGFGGEISGTVTSAENGDPLAGGRVRLWTSDRYYAGSATTGESGEYALGALDADAYFLTTDYFEGFFDELYDDLPCHRGGCEITDGTPVVVVSHAAVEGIDFALDQGGAVAGTVTDVSGEPIAGVRVEIYDQGDDRWPAYTYSDETGGFRVAGLAAGTYFAFADSDEYQNEIYDDLPCPGYCDPRTGTPIAVEDPFTTAGIDFALDRLGSIAGTVADNSSGEPISGARVEIWRFGGYLVGSAYSDEVGAYVYGGLPPDTYVANTDTYTHADELYDDVPCPDGPPHGCATQDGTPLAVDFNAALTGVDFALDRLGAVAGTVTDEVSGEPIAGVDVRLYGLDGSWYESATTDDAGEYQADGLEAGSYAAKTDADDHLDELYDDIPCPRGYCDPADGTPIPVEVDAITPGIDFALDRLGAIAGTVTDATTGEPISGAHVEAWRIANDEHAEAGYDHTDADGHYVLERLPPDAYAVAVYATDFVDELYDDIPCPPYACQPQDGTPVAVESGAITPGIDFALDRAGAIAGTVTDAATGAPLADIRVEIRDQSGSWVGDVYTDGSGSYTVGGLTAGTYFAHTDTYQNYLDELYDDLPCHRGCDPTAGTPIAVSLGATTGGIDFALDLGGTVSGTVTDAATGEPIYTKVSLWAADGSEVDDDYCSGPFSFAGLPGGTYFAKAADRTGDRYLAELYDDIVCLPGCDPTAGTPIEVTPGTTTTGIDFALDRGGVITGRVIDAASGMPTESARINVWDAAGSYVDHRGYVNSLGSYTVVGLHPGTYFVAASAVYHVAELYDDIPCPRTGCEPTVGTPVAVSLNAVTEGIDFALGRQGGISAKVVDAATGEPLESVRVEVWNDDEDRPETCWTNALGRCAVDGLYPGLHYAVTDNGQGYLDELYDGLPCLYGPTQGCVPTKGTPIPVVADSIHEIGFALMFFDSGIAGTVSDEAGEPLAGVAIDAWDAVGGHVAGTAAWVTGEYFLRLDPGTYTVSTDNGAGYVDQVYDGVLCPEGSAADGLCDPLLGQPITVDDSGPQMIVTSIDFELFLSAAVIFRDGFESGDLSAWSSSTGGRAPPP